MAERVANTTSYITEGMSLESAISAVFANIDLLNPDGTYRIGKEAHNNGLKLAVRYAEIGQVSYEDIVKLRDIGYNLQQNINREKFPDYYFGLVDGLNDISIFVSGVEIGKKLATQILLDSLK